MRDIINKLINMLDRHSVQLGYMEPPVTFAELIVCREGSEELDLCRKVAKYPPLSFEVEVSDEDE